MGALMRAFDWSSTPVGPVSCWPQSLRTALGILLDSGYPMYIAWGPEFTQFYNDAYRPILGSKKHPAALGQGTPECFAEIWDFIGPMFRRVLEEGKNTTLIDQL
ncbi:MAG: hybrid sensor histidine kinase/response regulator, partial [Acidobacteriota bacterium]